MGFYMHLCTSWLVCALLFAVFLRVTTTEQHGYLADDTNLVRPQTSSVSSASAGINGSAKLSSLKSFGLGEVKTSRLPLLAPPLQVKRVGRIHNGIIAQNQTKSLTQRKVKNYYSDEQTSVDRFQNPFLPRHRREASTIEENSTTSNNHQSSRVHLSEKITAYHSDNTIPSTGSSKPTKNTSSQETKTLGNRSQSSINPNPNPNPASSDLNTVSMTFSSSLSSLTPSKIPNTQSSVNFIRTIVAVSSSRSTKEPSEILPTDIVSIPSVIPSSSIMPTPQILAVENHSNSFSTSSTSLLDRNSQSSALLQPSMPSLGNTDYQSVKTTLRSTTIPLTSFTVSLAHVPTPTLTSSLLTNFSTSPIRTSSVLSNEIPDLSSTSYVSSNANKTRSTVEDQFHTLSALGSRSSRNSFFSTSTTQNVNFTLGDQPTPRIDAQTNVLSGMVPKSLITSHSKTVHTSESPSLILSKTVPFLPPSSSSPFSDISRSSTSRTRMATRLRIDPTSTWYHPESARMVSPLSPLPRSNSTMTTTTKPRTNTYTSVTRKPPLDGANYSLPRTVSELEPELEPTPKSASNTSGPDSKDSVHLLAEPVPDWEIAKKEWKAAWEVHLYLFGILFAILSLYSIASIIRLWHIKHMLSKPYFVAINLLIFVFCLLRTLFLLIDGYNSNHTFSPVIEYFLLSTGFPCLTSAFSILFYALLNATKVQMLPVQVQRLPALICVVLFHFLLSLSADILVAFFVNARILLFICQLFFILWGLFLFLGYLYAFKSLYSSAKKRQKSLLQLRQANSQWEGGHYSPANERLTLSLGIKGTLLSAIIGAVCVCVQAYAALGTFSVFSQETPQPWPWWAYQTAIRFIEFLFCFVMTYVATQPFKYHSKYDCDVWFYFSSCIQLFQIKSVWNTTNDPSWHELDDAITNTLVIKNGGRKEIKAAGYEIIPMTITLSTDADLSVPDPLENESMLVVEGGFVRFRTNEELEELRRSPRIPRMDLADPKPIPAKPKTLQWGENTTVGHQNGGFQSGDTIPGYMSPDCISTSTSPASSQWNRISTTGSEFTFRPPSLSLAESIDKELEHYFRRSSICSERSLSSIRSSSMPDGIAMGSSDTLDSNSVFPSEGSPCGNQPTDCDCLPDLDPTFSAKPDDKRGNVRDKLVNNVRYLSLDDLGKYPQSSSCGVRWKLDNDA